LPAIELFVILAHVCSIFTVQWSQTIHESYSKDFKLRRSLVERFLSLVNTRQEAVLYLTAWKYGPYLDEDPSGRETDGLGMVTLVEEAVAEG
jgi:hypothetical protein